MSEQQVDHDERSSSNSQSTSQTVYVDVDCDPEHRHSDDSATDCRQNDDSVSQSRSKPDDLDDADESQILLYHTTQGPKGIASTFDMTATTEDKAQELGAMPCMTCFVVDHGPMENFPYMHDGYGPSNRRTNSSSSDNQGVDGDD